MKVTINCFMSGQETLLAIQLGMTLYLNRTASQENTNIFSLINREKLYKEKMEECTKYLFKLKIQV